DTVEYALQQAKEFGLLTILNPAPYQDLTPTLLAHADYLTPSETEFESLAGKKLKSPEELELEMVRWSAKYKTKLIVTRGSRGSSFIEAGEVHTVPCLKVDVVDTTGAGDTFNGILAYAIAENMPLQDAVRLAGTGASLS